MTLSVSITGVVGLAPTDLPGNCRWSSQAYDTYSLQAFLNTINARRQGRNYLLECSYDGP